MGLGSDVAGELTGTLDSIGRLGGGISNLGIGGDGILADGGSKERIVGDTTAGFGSGLGLCSRCKTKLAFSEAVEDLPALPSIRSAR